MVEVNIEETAVKYMIMIELKWLKNLKEVVHHQYSPSEYMQYINVLLILRE